MLHVEQLVVKISASFLEVANFYLVLGGGGGGGGFRGGFLVAHEFYFYFLFYCNFHSKTQLTFFV